MSLFVKRHYVQDKVHMPTYPLSSTFTWEGTTTYGCAILKAHNCWANDKDDFDQGESHHSHPKLLIQDE